MPGRGERTAEGCRRDARDRAGEALGALGHMQFAQRIALLAHDALLSRRRALSVDLPGEVARKASARHRHGATAPSNPIRRRRIEFNKSVQWTGIAVMYVALASLAATYLPVIPATELRRSGAQGLG